MIVGYQKLEWDVPTAYCQVPEVPAGHLQQTFTIPQHCTLQS